jgi:shikimate 5-dehydrogenase
MQGALAAYSLVFDAVYTPQVTRLLKEAKEAGATVVSGIEMFIRQAMNQFALFTDRPGMCISHEGGVDMIPLPPIEIVLTLHML